MTICKYCCVPLEAPDIEYSQTDLTLDGLFCSFCEIEQKDYIKEDKNNHFIG
jgi:hypothetical protein